MRTFKMLKKPAEIPITIWCYATIAQKECKLTVKILHWSHRSVVEIVEFNYYWYPTK